MKTKRQVKQNKNIFSRWWDLTEPHKGYFAGQIIFYAAYQVMVAIFTIFAAKTINCMYAGDWDQAFMWLGIEIGCIVLRNVLFLNTQYYFYSLQCRHIRKTVSKKIYNKFVSCKSKELNNLSKEKVTNIALNNLANIAEFPDTIAIAIGILVQVGITLVVVFSANILAGVIVTALGVMNMFAYIMIHKRLGRIMLDRYEKKDDIFKSYSKIIDGKLIINELNAKPQYEDEIIDNVEKFSKAYTKYQMTLAFKDTIYRCLWGIVVYAITAFLLYKVSNGTLGMEVYLIIVPYLTSATSKLNELWDKAKVVENMRVDVDRVNLILNLNDGELVSYGHINQENMEYNLAFINITKKADKKQKYTLKKTNISFERESINLIKGPKENGKRVIFDLLRRYTTPDSGKILLDNLNLYDYEEKTFKTHINYAASHPTFIKGTIKENLIIVDKDFENIKRLCNLLGILDKINYLPNGFETNITEIDDSSILFMLGLARALLTNCKILMIYELPDDMDESYRQNIINLVTTQKINKTIILFTHSDDYDKYASRIFTVIKGQVNQIK